MSVGVLLITHEGIGQSMVNTVSGILDGLNLPTDYLEIPHEADVDASYESALIKRNTLDQGEGVLIITDVFGGTPSNTAKRIAEKYHCPMLAGLNLCMLIKINNYPSSSLQELAALGVEGANNGVLKWEQSHD